MRSFVAIIAAFGSLTLHGGLHVKSVQALGGHSPLERYFDPSPDGCRRQWSFTGPDLEIRAQLVGCWGLHLVNYSRSPLKVVVSAKREGR